MSGFARGKGSQNCMNILAAVVVFCLLPLLLAMAVRLAIAARRAGMPGWLAAVVAIGSVPALCGGAAGWISHRGVTETGVVTGKSEVLEVAPDGLAPSVRHRLILTVASPEALSRRRVARRGIPLFARLQQRGDLEFDVDERLYDSVKEGDALALHSVHLGPLQLARPDAEAWWDIAPGTLEQWFPWLHAAGAMTCGNASIAAVQRVRDAYAISLISSTGQGGAHTSLKEPYDEVRFHLRTAQGADILTLDRVDAGSAGALNPGDSRRVCYSTGRPRLAQLAVGTRTFEWRNTWSYWSTDILAFLAALVVTAALFAFWRRVRSRLRSSARGA